jgi:GH15 family glucan-1,4-alpha-glucosidase
MGGVLVARDLQLGNGKLLVTFDGSYRIRDIYYPHVGSENHTAGHINRFGVWVDNDFAWLDNEAWERTMEYEPGTLVTAVRAISTRLGLSLLCRDCVDFDLPILVRQIQVHDLTGRHRQVRVMFHYDSYLYETEVGDTVCYRPQSRALVFYKRERYLLAGGCAQVRAAGGTATTYQDGLASWATGTKGMHHAEGTWRDAEDGQLERNPIAQGSVDGVIAVHLDVPPHDTLTLHHWLCVGRSLKEVEDLSRRVQDYRPENVIRHTAGYWQGWAGQDGKDFGDLGPEITELYKRSLLIVRSQIDASGAIIAANDTDIVEVARDHYSYLWPRDGALVAEALDQAGYPEVTRPFYTLISNLIEPQGYLLHKYNPDGSLASSWHPWSDREGHPRLPIQEDESALCIHALWQHYAIHGDVNYVRPLYRRLIRPIAEFMTRFREPHTGLPAASFDLWEERHGILAWTIGAVWAGLTAAARFATLFGKPAHAARYRQAACEIRAAALRYLWSEADQSFIQMINVDDVGTVHTYCVPDSSIYGLIRCGMTAPDDPKAVSTMRALRESLTCKTPIGGVARYRNDYYYQISTDIHAIPGNPWFICTLWMAEYDVLRARSLADLASVRETLQWVQQHALRSGALPEQIHPLTGAPLSVCPLTWSHAALVGLVDRYMARRRELLNEHEQREPVLVTTSGAERGNSTGHEDETFTPDLAA